MDKNEAMDKEIYTCRRIGLITTWDEKMLDPTTAEVEERTVVIL
jgi:hypothetical protein